MIITVTQVNLHCIIDKHSECPGKSDVLEITPNKSIQFVCVCMCHSKSDKLIKDIKMSKSYNE